MVSPTQQMELMNKATFIRPKARSVSILLCEIEMGRGQTRVHAETIAMSEARALFGEGL